MKTKYLIVCDETNLDLKYYQKDFIFIGVERGCLDILNKNLTLDYAIADFDHVLPEELATIKANSKHFEHLNPQKDDLDGTYAIKKAYEMGATEIVFIAKPTKRVDFNLLLLEYCYKYRVKFVNDQTVAFCFSKGKHKLEFNQFQDYTYVTFFPVHDTTISISGLKYTTTDLKLLAYSSRAYSNCFEYGVDGEITTNNALLVILNK